VKRRAVIAAVVSGLVGVAPAAAASELVFGRAATGVTVAGDGRYAATTASVYITARLLSSLSH
jgi:hypothetical protein